MNVDVQHSTKDHVITNSRISARYSSYLHIDIHFSFEGESGEVRVQPNIIVSEEVITMTVHCTLNV